MNTRSTQKTRAGSTLTAIIAGILIFGFLFFITIPLAALFTRVTPADFVTAITSAAAMDALWLSAVTASISTVIVVVLGTPLAYVNARVAYRGRDVVDTLTDLPIVLPPTVAGLALLIAFGRNGLIGQYLDIFGISLPFTTLAVIISQIFVASPFYIRQARSSFEAVDRDYESASRTLGESPLRTFFRVTLPIAAGALLSGIIMTFARALGEFGATLMFAGNFQGRTQTMPLAIYTTMQSNMNVAVALAIVLVVFSFSVILTVKYISGRGERNA
jgi:molybdate transport system permease protein